MLKKLPDRHVYDDGDKPGMLSFYLPADSRRA